jgi:hypothetical protein
VAPNPRPQRTPPLCRGEAGEGSGARGLGFSPRVPRSNQILMIPGPLSNELLLDFGQASGRGLDGAARPETRVL